MTDLISIGMERGTSQLNAAKYSVVTADNSYHGEIRFGITFTAAKVLIKKPRDPVTFCTPYRGTLIN